jgi:hypothetical protein
MSMAPYLPRLIHFDLTAAKSDLGFSLGTETECIRE